MMPEKCFNAAVTQATDDSELQIVDVSLLAGVYCE
jgi:hypothetical protein